MLSNLLSKNRTNSRVERKFFLADESNEKIELSIKFHPCLFREIYQRRQVNNLYLDSIGLKHFFDNINGVPQRLKVRIRWYGATMGLIKSPVLEIKSRDHEQIAKHLFPLKSFILDDKFSFDTLVPVFEKADLPNSLGYYLKEMELVLLNRYNRQYYLSADGHFRVTVDSGLLVCKLNNLNNTYLCQSFNKENRIIELKYAPEADVNADSVSRYFPWRLTKSSKYVDGVRRLYPEFG